MKKSLKFEYKITHGHHPLGDIKAIETGLFRLNDYFTTNNEPANYTWSSSFIATSGGITRLTGIDINHVVDVSAGNQGKGNTLLVTATAPSVTTNYANDIVINFFGSYASLADPYFVEGSYIPPLTPLYEWAPAYAGGAYDPPSLAAYHWTMESAGNTNARNCRLSKGTTTAGVWWQPRLLTLKPRLR